MLCRLVYVSTLRPHVTPDDLSTLVRHAAEANRKNGITGILAVESARVCQILEGPTEAIEALFTSIRRDERHSRVSELSLSEITAPHFESWGMVQRPMVDIVTLAYSL